MKISDVKKTLEQYKYHVSSFRAWKKEQHVQKLQDFYIEINKGDGAVINDRELSDEEYVRLANLLLGKKTWNENPSSIALGVLANKMGGLKALEQLKKEAQLNARNLKLVEQCTALEESQSPEVSIQFKDENHGLMLAELLTVLSSAEPSLKLNSLTEICRLASKKNLVNKINYIEELVTAKVVSQDAFALVLECKNPMLITKLLVLLDEHGLCKEENIKNLRELDGEAASSQEDKLVLLHEILSLFAAEDPLLMMQSRLKSLFEHSEFWSNIKLLAEELQSIKKLNSTSIADLFTNDETIEILACFQQAGWDIKHYWAAIIRTAQDSMEIKLATHKLSQLNLSSTQVQLVLNCLFVTPRISQKMVEGVELLIERASPIYEKDLKAVLDAREHAVKLAEGIALARNLCKGYDAKVRQFISQDPEEASGLAKVYNELELANLNRYKSRKLVLSKIKNANFGGLILEQMRLTNLFNESNPNSMSNLELLYSKEFIDAQFCEFQAILVQNGLFDQPNFDSLVMHAKYRKELFQASTKLVENKKLNQGNLNLLFEMIVETPDQIGKVAEILCKEERVEEGQEELLEESLEGQEEQMKKETEENTKKPPLPSLSPSKFKHYTMFRSQNDSNTDEESLSDNSEEERDEESLSDSEEETDEEDEVSYVVRSKVKSSKWGWLNFMSPNRNEEEKQIDKKKKNRTSLKST